MIKRCIALLLLVAFESAAVAQEPVHAPFGLRWGASLEDLAAAGVEAEFSERQSGVIDRYLATTVPRPLSDASNYYLDFDREGRLFAVTTVIGPWERDLDGAEVRARYVELKEGLSANYSLSEERDYIHSPGMDGKNWTVYLGAGFNDLWVKFDGAGLSIDLVAGAHKDFNSVLFLTHRNLEIATEVAAQIKAADQGRL